MSASQFTYPPHLFPEQQQAITPSLDPPPGIGTDVFAIVAWADNVCLSLPPPASWLAMTPEESYRMAELLSRHAFAVEIKDKVEGEWSSLVQRKRQNLLAKIEHALIAAATNGDISVNKSGILQYLAAQIRDHADDEYLGPRLSL